jgi:hypothetical protein
VASGSKGMGQAYSSVWMWNRGQLWALEKGKALEEVDWWELVRWKGKELTWVEEKR